MAGGSLDMCNVGSSPMVVGYANGVKASLVYIYKNIIDSEALVVQKSAGISQVADLKGKRIGLPFNTSVHFAALAALKNAGLGVGDVQLINMRADTIASVWAAARDRRSLHLDPGAAQARRGQRHGDLQDRRPQRAPAW